MSVTGHKSIQSLCIYQRVKEDKKLMMGMSLTYSVLNPNEVTEVKAALRRQRELAEIENDLDLHDDDNSNQSVPALPPPPAKKQKNMDPPPHALDPNIPQLVPLESALQPYTPPPQNIQPEVNTPDFDLMEIVSEFEGVNDDQLVPVATQIENASTTSLTKAAIMKKNSPKLPPLTPTFNNCTFGNIGTLNIHIHKH